MRAAAVIAVTAAVATFLGLLLARVPSGSTEVAVGAGVLIPPSLCANRLPRQKPDSADRAFWYQIATLGVTLLLDKLDQQVAEDREKWCDDQIRELGLDVPSLDECRRRSPHSYDRGITIRFGFELRHPGAVCLEEFGKRLEFGTDHVYDRLAHPGPGQRCQAGLQSDYDAVGEAMKAMRVAFNAGGWEREVNQALHSAVSAFRCLLRHAYNRGCTRAMIMPAGAGPGPVEAAHQIPVG